MGVQVVSESASKVNLKLPGSHPTMEDLSHSAVPPSYQVFFNCHLFFEYDANLNRLSRHQ